MSPFTLNKDKISRKHLLGKTFKIQIPAREDWQDLNFLINPNVWYMDGSK